MLEKLPPEILRKIFNKTDLKIAPTCRLLNRHFNEVITRYELHKRRVDHLMIDFGCITATRYCRSNGKKSQVIGKHQFNEGFRAVLENVLRWIRLVKKVTLNNTRIDQRLCELLSNQECLRNTKSLQIKYSSMHTTIDQFYAVMQNMKLQNVYIFNTENPCGVLRPTKKMLEYIGSSVVFVTTGNQVKLGDFDDGVLIDWLTPQRELQIKECRARFTLIGLEDYFKRVAIADNPKPCDLGILVEVSADELEELLATFNAKKIRNNADHLSEYQIESLHENPCEIIFVVSRHTGARRKMGTAEKPTGPFV